jgi:hypothetical protein
MRIKINFTKCTKGPNVTLPPIDPKQLPSRGQGPYHRLQEAIDRIEVHCRVLTAQGVPSENTDALRRLADQFTNHFMALDRLRSRTAQLTELWEQP